MFDKILIVSDTHVGDRNQEMAPEFWQGVDEADMVIHAGDWTSLEFMQEVKGRARRLIGVKGNNDDALGDRLPEVATWMVSGLIIAVTHICRIEDVDERFPDADVVIFGHSHRTHDSISPAGIRRLNPGSTMNYERWAGGSNLMTATLRWDDRQLEVRTHRLRNADRPIQLWP